MTRSSCWKSRVGLEEFAPDYGQVLDDLAALLTRVALRQIVTGYEADELFDAALIDELATAIGAEDVQLYYQTAILGRRDLALAPDPRSGFQMTLVRMLAFRPAARRRVPRTRAAGTCRRQTARRSQSADGDASARCHRPGVRGRA